MRDPEVRYTKAGKPVVNLTIATTPRSYNRDTSQWEDGKTVFTRASAWDEMAENIGASLTKGSRVVVVGVFKAGEYTTKEGEVRDTTELQIDEIGQTLRHHTLVATKRGKDVPATKGPAQAQPKVDNDGWAVVDDDTPF